MKAKLVRLLCLVLCVMTVMPVLTAAAETTKVAAYLLRLRETPSDKGKVIDAYPRGTVVTILKKGEEWTKVKVYEKTGYMKTSMLAYSRMEDFKGNKKESSQKSSSGSRKSGDSSSGTTMYIMKGVRLNLREEPNSSSDIIASFRGGTKVTVLRRGRYWSYVEVKGLYGYMGNDYLVSEKE